jgi:hypothetical protein
LFVIGPTHTAEQESSSCFHSFIYLMLFDELSSKKQSVFMNVKSIKTGKWSLLKGFFFFFLFMPRSSSPSIYSFILHAPLIMMKNHNFFPLSVHTHTNNVDINEKKIPIWHFLIDDLYDLFRVIGAIVSYEGVNSIHITNIYSF